MHNMAQNKKIRVGITHGDINGIGYEVIMKALEDPLMTDLCTPIVYGSSKALSYHRKALEMGNVKFRGRRMPPTVSTTWWKWSTER